MKASEAKVITKLVIEQARKIQEDAEFLKTKMPEYYAVIEQTAKQGLNKVSIGKPDRRILDQLKKDGYNISFEDDGDCHSSRVLRYFVNW